MWQQSGGRQLSGPDEIEEGEFMPSMNPRQRFNNYMRFQTADRPPYLCWNGTWAQTVERWYGEGLPRNPDGHPHDELRQYFGFDGPVTPAGIELWKSLGRGAVRVGLRGKYTIPFSHKALPPPGVPRERLIQETDRYRIFLLNGGPLKMKCLKNDRRFRHYYDYPDLNRKNFEMMKKFYAPYHPDRYPRNHAGTSLRALTRDIEYPVELRMEVPSLALGFFGGHRRHEVLMSYYDKPGLVGEIVEFFTEQTMLAVEDILHDCTVDYVDLVDDGLAYSHGPWISPQIFRKFMLSHYQRLMVFLRARGVDLILGYFGGNFTDLMPLFLEMGLDGFTHLSAENGMDAPTLRREYGQNLRIIDNINYRVLTRDKKAIEGELERKLPLVEEGGYIPSIDEEVPLDVPFESFAYYNRLLKAGLGILA